MNPHFSSDQRQLTLLLELLSAWNPLGHPQTESSHYESLAVMTLESMRDHPSHEELVESLKYFIGLESHKQALPAEPHIHEFAKQILSDSRLACPRKHYVRTRER